MRNFKDKNLWESEVGLFEKFTSEKLVTSSEYNKYDTGEEEEIEDDFFSGVVGFGGDDFSDISSGNDFNFDNDFSSSGLFGGSDFGQQNNYNDWEQDTKLNSFLASPLYLSRYVFDDITDDENKTEEDKQTKFNFKLDHAKDFFKYINISGAFLFSTSLLSYFGFMNTLHHPIFGLITGASCLIGGDFFNWKYFNQGLFAKYKKNDHPLVDDIETNNSNEMDSNPFGSMENSFGVDGEEVNPFSFDEDGFDFGEDDNKSTISLFDDEEDEEYHEDLDDDYEDDTDDTILGKSDVETSNDKLFQKGLIKEFQKNEIYEGERLDTRKEILDSFSGLLLNNDKKFSSWRKESEKSTVYNNIAYTIYKALVEINKQFSTDEKAKLTVLSIESSPLLYKIQVKLPQTHFTQNKVKNGIDSFTNYLKKDDSDTQVQCSVTVSGDMFTFRFIRLDYKGLISIGDILRYKDDSGKTAYEKMIDPKAFTPMLVGLKDNEYPHVIDLQGNTAMAIVGGSGSGKSWLTYELGMNLVTTSSYNEVNFIVLDYKNAMFWKSFARMPHVLGYHAPDGANYTEDQFLADALKITNEVVLECQRRQGYLSKIEVEDIKEAHQKFRKSGDFDRIKEIPMLIFIIDEITSTMNKFEQLGKDEYDAFRNNLNVIAQVGRSAGVRLLTVGQRSIDKSLPKNVKMNTTLKFGMKMGESDLNLLFEDKTVEKMPKPTSIGQGIVTSEDILGYHSIKTLTPGGTDNEQIRMLLRTVSFDWLRRARGLDDLYSPPLFADFKIAYNRPKFLDLSYKELSTGYLLGSTIHNPEVAVDLLSPKQLSPLGTSLLSDEDKEVAIENVDKYIEDLEHEDNEVEVPNFDMDSIVDSIKVNEFDIEDMDGEEDYYPEEDIEKENNSSEELLDTENYLDDIEDTKLNVDFEISQENFKLNLDTDYDNEDNEYEDEIEELPFTELTLDGIDEEDEEDDEVIETTNVDIEEDLFALLEDNNEDLEKEKANIKREKERIQLEKERISIEQERLALENSNKLEREKKELEQERLELERLRKESEDMKVSLEKARKEKEEKALELQKVKSQEKKSQEDLNNNANSTVTIENPKPKANEPKMDIRQFIILNGTSSSQFEKVIPKDALLKVYTKAEIRKASNLGDILEYADSYMVQI